MKINDALSACALAYMLGRKLPDTLGNHFQYIKHYAEKAGMSPVKACMKHIATVELVLKEILKHTPLSKAA